MDEKTNKVELAEAGKQAKARTITSATKEQWIAWAKKASTNRKAGTEVQKHQYD